MGESDLKNVAVHALDRARALGVQEAKAWIARGSEIEMEQREGRLVKSCEASSRGLSMSMLVDDRFSTHSTSDLRPAALDAFLARAVDATRTLEPDPDRALIARERMGTLPLEGLDLCDTTPSRSALQRRADVAEVEAAILEEGRDNVVSVTAYGWEGNSEAWALFSNGFEAYTTTSSFGSGGEVTLREDSGKLPETAAFFSARHLEDVPPAPAVSKEIWRRASWITDAGSAPSGRYPMLLANHAVGRIFGTLLGPLTGSSIWQGRSIFVDKLGEQVAASGLSLWDEPMIPRGLGTRPFDGDGMAPRRRPILEEGLLKTWLLDVYHARKLEREPNCGSVTNLVVEAGDRSLEDMAAELPKAIYVTSFLGGNSNPASGDFSFGVRGQLLEKGEVVQNISEMNISGNLLELLGNYQESGNDPWKYASYRIPTIHFADVQFSGS